MKKFLKGLLAFILIIVVVGGLGYIGYSYYYINPVSIQSNGQVDSSVNQDQQGLQHGSMTDTSSNTEALEAVRVVMAYKESLDTAVAALNEAMSYMTLDPYSPSDKTEGMGNMTEVQTPQTAPQVSSSQGNTTINIYPNTNNTQQNTMPPMTNMGTVYDATKMEQLHTGLYKLSVGMQLLGQLSGELVLQAEYANKDIQNPGQFYTNQYTMLLQNKSKLNNALSYINEASGLVNINPYVSEKGLVYDKDRMKKIHESIYRMAEGVASLNKLSDEMTMQAVNITNAAQAYANNANMNASMGVMNNSANNAGSGMFANVSMPTIINIILIVFVTMFILGLLGFIFSLLKTSSKNLNKDSKIANQEQ